VTNDPVQVTLLGEGADNADVGVIVWNAERRYVAANARACELLGVTREQLLASTVGSTNRSPETRALIDDAIAHVPASGSMTVLRSDGSQVEVDWLVFSTRVAGLEHVLGLFWDRTKLA
jgi:PAS domain S-box-containing protein